MLRLDDLSQEPSRDVKVDVSGDWTRYFSDYASELGSSLQSAIWAADLGLPYVIFLKGNVMVDSRDDVLPVGKLPGELLARLITTYATTDPTVIVGPGVGGDAAAIDLGGATLVVKTDPITFATQNAARYLVNVNANDLACLGATARWMMITALLPEGGTTEALVESYFRELRDACRERDIFLVGGHTEITRGLDRPILVGVLMGEVAASSVLRPGGARPGDQLLLTKALAIEGTALLARELGPRLSVALDSALMSRAANLLYDPGISVVLDATILLRAGGGQPFTTRPKAAWRPAFAN